MSGASPPLRKTMRPRLHAALRRDRLFARLDALRDQSLTWISGPPGAGKTTLAASYLDARGLGGVWYQVDGGDRDVSTFFYYLREAVRPLLEDGVVLPLLTAEYQGDPRGFARRWFRRLFAAMPAGAVLVLDNYQEASEADLDDVLAVLVEEIPDGHSAMVISRSEPPPELARATTSRDVGRLRWEDLRLTESEVMAVGVARGVTIGASLRRELDRCDGWAAGVALMLDRVRQGQTGDASVSLDSMETLFGYFSGLVFDELAPEERRALVACSFLPGISLPAALSLTGNATVGDLLDELYRRRLFTSRSRDDDPTYEFHALFREYLQIRSRDVLTMHERRSTLRLAAELLQESGQDTDAMALYAEISDWSAVEATIIERAQALLAQGRGRTVLDWIALLPAQRLEAAPAIQVWLGTALLPLDQQRARAVLTRAYEALEARNDFTGMVAAASGVVETYFFSFSGYAGLREWTPGLASLLAQSERFVSGPQRLQACSGYLLAALFTDGAHPELPVYVNEIRQLIREPIDAALRLRAGSFLLTYASATLRPAIVADDLELLDGLAADPLVPPVRQAQWHQRYASRCNELGEYELAEARLARAEQLCITHGLRAPLSLILQTAVFVASARGDAARAQEILTRWRTFLSPDRPVERSQWNFARLVVVTDTGTDREQWGALARELAAQMDETGQTWIRLSGRFPGLHALIACGELDAARQWIKDMRNLIQGTAFDRCERDLLVAEAHLALTVRDEAAAQALIARALRETREQGIPVRCAHGLRGLQRVLAYACKAGVEVETARWLGARYRIPLEPQDTSSQTQPVRVLTLGRFELRIDGQPLQFKGKAQARPLSLLKLLVAHGEGGMPVSQVTSTLWPDADGDRAANSLKVAVHRLRKLLGYDAAVRTGRSALWLDPQWCWTDVAAFETHFATAERHRRAGDEVPFIEAAESALRMFRGEFLPAEEVHPWVAAARDRVARIARQLTLQLGEALEARGSVAQACVVYEAGLAVDPLSEKLYQRIMAAHLTLSQPAEAMQVFRRCRDMLSIVLGLQPSAETHALFDRAREAAARREASVTRG